MPTEDLIDPRAFDPARVELGPDKLREMYPQRFEMEQLHGILHFDREKCLIVGVRRVTADEWWVRGHVPGRPILPAVLMLEAAAQLGTVYLRMSAPDHEGKGMWGFGGIDDARFRGIVVPGDTLVLAVWAKDVRRKVCKFEFQGFVGEKRVVEGTVLGILLG